MVATALLLVLKPVQGVALSKKNNVDVDIDFTVNYTPEDDTPTILTTEENERYTWTESNMTCLRSFDEVITTTSPEGIQLGRTVTPMTMMSTADQCCLEGDRSVPKNESLLAACTCTTTEENSLIKFGNTGTCTREYDEVVTKTLSTGALVSREEEMKTEEVAT